VTGKTKRFGKHTYDLYSEYRTKITAENGARQARKKGFARVRVVQTGKLPVRMDREDYPWAVYVDVKSLKGSINEAALKAWVHMGAPEKGVTIKRGYRV
jgi:hypothetical protein